MNPIIINSIGLIFDIVGAIIIFIYTPSLFEEDENGDVMPSDTKDNKRKIKLSRVGIALIIIGFFLQYTGSIMQLCK